MQKQHKRHFEVCAIAAKNQGETGRKYAIEYLEGMLPSCMSNRAIKEIKEEIAKYK